MWEMLTEFLADGFGLAHPWFLQPPFGQLAHESMFALSLSFSFFLSFSLENLEKAMWSDGWNKARMIKQCALEGWAQEENPQNMCLHLS